MKLPKVYEASQYEDDIYALWEKSEVFVAHPESKKEHFSISMPPPNETGTLHVGHALFLTLQDILARHARQQGNDVLWLPGTDHAALPVNALIEKALADEGKTKHDIGRDAFLERTREFVGNSRDTINGQVRAMGASVDWTRSRYTLDDALNRCVNETFVKMYNDGLIYRGHRIVNWDPNLETNVSDDEVVYKEEKGKFYTFKYGPFEIGTARPETKFGDKYVVVHPDDERYSQYEHGQKFTVEWINGPIEATLIKDEAADPEFGTGAMTITPWHSQVDFEIAERHGLDREQIIDFHGKLLPIAGEFAGLPIAEARDQIVAKLEGKGLLVNIDENYVHNIALNDRGKGVIEPQIRLQWFVDVNKPVVDWKGQKRSLKEVMQAVINDGDIELIPQRFEKIYFHWIDNLRDWCISRQIWWGHRIPVWYREDTDGRQETYVGVQPPTDESEGLHDWQQDPDTLDTWFSSALWTWSTLIDPKLAADMNLSFDDLLQQSLDFQTYHPTSVMETGWDILFFWVARMILSTTYMTGQVPFKQVYLHGLVRTEHGKKMSKSDPETIIDPLEVIPEFGTDSLRLALVQNMSAGNDQRLGKTKIITNRNFCNKLWNIARYIEDIVGDQPDREEVKPSSAADHWILHKIRTSHESIGKDLDNFRFSEAYDTLYHFVWDDLADWYIEASKAEPNKPLLAYLLEQVLLIAHPFAPFLTETIWQTLKWEDDSILASRELPQIIEADGKQASDFAELQAVVSEARFITRALKVNDASLFCHNAPFLIENTGVIKQLSRVKDVVEAAKLGNGVRLTGTKYSCWLDIDHKTAESYVKELKTKQTAQKSVIKQLEARLKNKSYVEGAPEAVVQQTRDQLAAAEALLNSLDDEIKRFSA
ncbi:MAG TPA: valine--tRNA ligase [Candidatus Saccharimonadales bacterium]|nr:valine--tRNA ligase [Candidatus Saccharimonadales bacterium]